MKNEFEKFRLRNAECKFVDYNKLYLDFIGQRVLLAFQYLEGHKGKIIGYISNTWSRNWEDFTIPVITTLNFDVYGNFYNDKDLLDGPDEFFYFIHKSIIKPVIKF
ncbi:MAG TPA: hypothetical protein P5273_06525 [Syntrophomonadaceae bacterium]|nr:hypothetical protein [Syntrophomonadaceae bacterium]